MIRRTVYSQSRQPTALGHKSVSPTTSKTSAPQTPNGPPKGIRLRFAQFVKYRDRLLFLLLGILLSLAAVLIYETAKPNPQQITQEDIDQAVLYSLDNLPPNPSISAVAYEVIRPSVVLVRRLASNTEEQDLPIEEGVGTGVVIVDSGAILTSLHVVYGAELIHVVFADGYETPAVMISAQPENDLAVIQAEIVPEGLVTATLTTTRGLSPGDEVVVVGHPFGIGESTSAGVISGLGRDYVAEDGQTIISNLIQFDAAVNPGNSGGPLVNNKGEVIGIVSSIYNPNNERVFIGIGFAVPIETAAASFGQLPY